MVSRLGDGGSYTGRGLSQLPWSSVEANRESPPLEVFVSYAHRDEDLRRQLDTHLSLLRREGLITTWHDRRIVPGTEWAIQIDERLATAELILLLASPDFLASDF